MVANGKGIASRANPDGPVPNKRRPKNWMENYTGTMFRGTVSVINFPQSKVLAEMSRKVYDNTPFIKKVKEESSQSVIPKRPGCFLLSPF